MKWIAATVSAETVLQSIDSVTEILADLFYGLGLKGVVINETPEKSAGQVRVSVTGYFPSNESLSENRSLLASSVRALAVDAISRCALAYEEIDEEDWADSWKDHFYPQKIGRHIVVKPTWRNCEPASGDIVIEIDPGMAFGTGTHATTRMCLISLERYFKKGMSFLDVGTGSGILMVGAFLMGATRVCGVDNDPVAVEIARANLALNRVPSDRSGVSVTDLVDGVGGPFDMVCANILAEVVVKLIPAVKQVLAPGGMFVCSGIIRSKRGLVEDQLQQFGFRIVDEMTEEEWVCIVSK